MEDWEWVGVAIKGKRRDSYGNGTVLYLHYIYTNTLLVILYYRFARCYHWGTLNKRYVGSLLFLTIECEPIIISKTEFFYSIVAYVFVLVQNFL